MGRRSAFAKLIQHLGTMVLTLVSIALLTSFGLTMAARGRHGIPSNVVGAIGDTLRWTFDYIVHHPTTYFWNRETFPALELVLTILGRSAGLLLLSLAFAVVVGVPLGMAAALARRKVSAPLVLIGSVLGMSTPTFLLGMLLWIVNIQAYRQLGVKALPSAGFGWDGHMIMPALVLAARPLAQIAQVTYVALSEQLGEDYVRTARAKGLAAQVVHYRHALRNALIPILTTIGTSLRFSLASLPVVEFFFAWPGVGRTLLEAISRGEAALVTDLILSLGLFFLLVNRLLELLYPLLDPRLRGNGGSAPLEERRSWRQQLTGWKDALAEWFAELRDLLPGRRKKPSLPPLPAALRENHYDVELERKRRHPGRWIVRNILRNPIFVIGTLLVAGFVMLGLFGSQLTDASPYEIHGIMTIEGTIAAPPFKPSSVFPWGSDQIGRDIQSLVLWGGQQTLALAFFAMLARVLVGTILGLLAGWWQNRWFDRLVNGAIGVWAAFPATILAMLLIQALGIQQGMSVFVIALCVVGWSEVAQFVRAQVIALKPQLFIEAARALGARAGRILARHVLPHLIAPLLVLAVLEMGGILLLLAELGFLNIFLGGGFRVELSNEAILHFSDVPEWGAMLANVRQWWRSYPWLAWYPGLAFFLVIIAFNLFGEGLRRFLESSRINLSRLVNRYTLAVLVVAVFGLVWALRSTAPLSVYTEPARAFDAQRALADIRILSDPALQGRETGTPGAEEAANYIARRMKEIGLFPAGQQDTFIHTMASPRFRLTEVPRLEILDGEGNVVEALRYRQDFVERALGIDTMGHGQGPVVGLALGPDPGTPGDPYTLGNRDLYDRVILLRETNLSRLGLHYISGVLLVSDDPEVMVRRYLYGWQGHFPDPRPTMFISPEVADRLLATAGSSLAELDRQAAVLGAGEVFQTDPGAPVRLSMAGETDMDDVYYHVIGHIPGTGAEMGAGRGQGLDHQVILVSAYYDGLGVGPDGTLYPGANDNASGVAVMLELARVLKSSPIQPKKTVVFVAWAGGERYEELSVTNMMNAKRGFSELEVEVVIELSGMGAGSGSGLALGQGSSFRLVQLWQEAAGRMGVSTTTRGRDPHYGLPFMRSFGGRSALTIYLSWDGSDQNAHTPADTVEQIDVQKLEKAGRTTLLGLFVLCREVDY